MGNDQERLNARLLSAAGQSAAAIQAALEAGADANAVDSHGQSALFRLINHTRSGRPLSDKQAEPRVRALLQGGARPDEPGNTSFMEPHDSAPPLHCAIYLGWARCAQALLASGADPWAEDTLGMTPFDYLVFWARGDAQRAEAAREMARALVEHGADIDAEGGVRVPPLMLAVLELNEPLAEALLEAGADPRWKCQESGRNALHALAGGMIAGNELGSFTQVDAAARLAMRFMELGLGPEDEDFEGETPLGLAEGEMKALLLSRQERQRLLEQTPAAPASGRRPRV